jgi:hypothetical protein
MMLGYQILAMVEVLNDYFSDGLCTDLTFTPAADTAGVLKGQRLLCKTVGSNFVLLTQVDPQSGTSPITLPALTKLRFYISVNNPAFINYTNINYAPLTAGKYYFTNLNQTTLSGTLYLNEKVPKYNNANTYNTGDLVDDGTNTIFEAIQGSSTTNKQDTTKTAYWLKKGQAQYVNGGDLVTLTGSNYQPSAPNATSFTVNIYTLDTTTNQYNVQVLGITQNFPVAQTPAAIDLTGLPVGLYRVSINAKDTYIYLDDAATNQNILGVLELFNHLPAANDFSLFNASGQPKQSTFTLRFANRSAIWKYIARTADVTGLKDTATGSVYTFSSPATNTFVSNIPIPFRDQPISTITVQSTSLGDVPNIANPDANRLSPVFQGGQWSYYAEKYLNY